MAAPSTSGIPNTKNTLGAPNKTISLRELFVDAETASSALTFSIESNSNPGLFATAPSINPTTGVLTLDYNDTLAGTADIKVRATDVAADNNPATPLFVETTFTVTTIAATGATASADIITGGNGEDYLDGAAGDDSISGLNLNDTLIGGIDIDSLAGGTGDDLYSVDVAGDVVTENPLEGTDTVKSVVTYTLGSDVEKLILESGAVDGTGNALDNTISGNTVANKINGGVGHDTMTGSTGDDTYVVDNTGDVVTEVATQGTDTVESFIDFTLGADVENLTLKGTAAKGTGNTAGNILIGNTAANVLSGGTGSDDMTAGAGNDTYVVDALGDAVNEANTLGEVDTVQSSINYTLGNNVENLTLTGNAATGTGNSLTNYIIGNTVANILDGGAGKDTLIGGAGNDTYVIDFTGEEIQETSTSSAEIDTVKSSVNRTLGDNLENLVLDGTAANGTGNALDNTLTGNSSNNLLNGDSGDDTINGAAGDDTMKSADGNDTYVVTESGDVVTETGSIVTEVDTVESSIASYTLNDSVEKLVLNDIAVTGTGNSLNNIIIAKNTTPTDNVIIGAGGNDTMTGGTGNDIYFVAQEGDIVTETSVLATELDTVKSAVNYTLGTNVEKLELTGSAISGTGNTLNNTLTGNAVGNTLSGGTGSDTMTGGAGDDTYVVDIAGDVVTEVAAEGTDTIQSSVTETLDANVENLTLTGINAINGTGNTLNNTITGNIAANRIDGDVGNDTMIGGAGNDIYVVDVGGDDVQENSTVASETDKVESLVSYSLGANLEQLTLTGSGVINGTGNTLNNSITGNGVANTLTGGTGSDTMTGGLGDDIYVVDATGDQVSESSLAGAGSDKVQSSVTYTLGNNVENLELTSATAINATGNNLANDIKGNTGNNILAGGTEIAPGLIDTLSGGAGDDTYLIGNETNTDTITETAGQGTDTVSSSITYTLGNNLEKLTLTGTAAINGTGNTENNTITGNTAANTLDGAAGSDTMIGGTGNDVYKVDSTTDVVTETSNVVSEIDTVKSDVTYALGANLEKLEIFGAAANATGNTLGNTLTGNNGVNRLDGGTGSDTMTGSGANDTYVVDNVGDFVIETGTAGQGSADKIESSVTFTLGKGNDTILGENGENVEELTLTGTAAINATGNELANTITGNTKNNILSGGGAADTLIGGAGDDTYLADITNDTVTEAANEGTDTVSSSATYTLGNNLEHLTLTGTDPLVAINGTGNDLDNKITGNTAANTLTGGLGKDTMTGGTGNDTYIVDNLLDVVTETSALTAEVDTVKSSVDFTLSANVEALELTASAISGTGNTLNNTILGNASNNLIDGKAGTDTMTGGAGDDTYTIDAILDVVTEGLSGGTDKVNSTATYTLSANVENLELTGTTAINGTGNELANTITGNAGSNSIDGKAGVDTMIGGTGNDTYTVDVTGDVVTETSALATEIDTVNSSDTYTLGANIEKLTLTGATAINGTGNALANTITGNTANNALDGLAGNDTMIGGTGNDSYTVDATLDVVTETSTVATEIDTVNSSDTFTLGANIENLTLTTGAGDINGTGNTLNNTIVGNGGINILSGGTGNDTMTGNAGNDTYIVDAAGDVVTETPTGGTADKVESSVTETLDANVENLTLTGISAINGTGNTENNIIIGNDAANTLSGEGGDDAMTGKKGDDIYVVDVAGDAVSENTAEGTDTVKSSITYTLGANVEKLTLTGTAAINGTGNDLANTILGNTGNNTLSGLAGNDSMTGGAGNDTYVVDATGDLVTEILNEGTDKVESSVTYTLGANVENLTLTGSGLINGTGNTLSNTIIGNTAANTLNGGTGIDDMKGAGGDDIYVVDADLDVVDESAGAGGAGIDTIQSSVTEILADNVEKLTLTGTNAISGTGNILDNIIVGNSAANTLTGLDGNDSMTGGAGNDIYVVNATGDVVTELAAGGTDTVESSVTETLDVEVENLTLTGTNAINATGNVLANTIKGNSAANTLSGLVGNDTMIGGTGNDTYTVDATGDVVTEAVDTVDGSGNVITGGTDTVQSSVTETLDANVENLTLTTGAGNINGTGNALNNIITGNDGNNTLSGGAGVDELIGGAGDDTFIVDSTTDTITDSAGTDLVSSSVSYTLGAGLDNLTLTGTSLISGTGNGDSNKLIGNSAGNSLSADAGNDSLTGGAGNDTLTGDAGSDKFIYDSNAAFTSSGLGIDRITDFASGDKIVLDQTTFTALTSLATQFAVVGTDAAASTSPALIVYSSASDNLFYNQNGTVAGYGTGAQFATLADNEATIIPSDFELQA